MADSTFQFQIQKAENDEGVEWKRKSESHYFLVGFNGAHLMQPFQCDTCWFRNLQNRLPNNKSYTDMKLMAYIRRVNLDILWSRASTTSYMSQYKKALKVDLDLGLIPKHYPKGPWPLKDDVGFQIALEIVGASLLSGKTSRKYQQFDTIRSIRTMHQHMYESGPCRGNLVFKKSNKGDVIHTSQCPTNSLLFTRFMEGCLKRMGKEVKSDLALDPSILHLILKNLNNEWLNDATTNERRRWISVVGCYLIVCFTCSLRGNEGFMIDFLGLRTHIKDGKSADEKTPHVVIPLLGRFKNEVGERLHLMLSVDVTKSGFKVRDWVERLVLTLWNEGKRDGPAICDSDGYVVEASRMNQEFREQLTIVQIYRPDLIKSNINVFEMYNIRRSLRRGSSSIARREGVSGTVIDLVNRWSINEYSRGRSRGYRMRDYYTEIRMVMHTILPYSASL